VIRRFTAALIDSILHRLERSASANDQYEYLRNQLLAFSRRSQKWDTPTQNDLFQAWQAAVEMGVLSGDQPFTSSRPWPYLSLDEAKVWLASLPGGRPLGKAGFSAGLGQCLDVLDSAGHPAASDLLERTLRHVEVKRQDCLSSPIGADSPSRWLERHDVTLAFCRAARRHNDLRFLNAALKMTDWYAKRYRSAGSHSGGCARFLLALAIQEVCAREFGL
jgi:hypothetical protein